MSSNISRETPKYCFLTAKVRNYGIPLLFSKMALHGGGHLGLKKNAQGGFLGPLRNSCVLTLSQHDASYHQN